MHCSVENDKSSNKSNNVNGIIKVQIMAKKNKKYIFFGQNRISNKILTEI